MTASDYMRYIDVMYDGAKYRGVTFDTYRPYNSSLISTESSSDSSLQDDRGYYTGNIYWFMYEPIEWRVLDRETGMLMSNIMLDSQPYNNYMLIDGYAWYGDADKSYYLNNYEKSSIREWLNNDFYNTAFSPEQQKMIKHTTLDNSAYSTSYYVYDSASTSDKIYLLSYSDVTNSEYGFGNSEEMISNRIIPSTDYAKSQGLYVYSNSESEYIKYPENIIGNSDWRLRSAGADSRSVTSARGDGSIFVKNAAFAATTGIVPALNIDLIEIRQCSVEETGTGTGSGLGCVGHTPSPAAAVKENEVPATCTKEGSYDDVVYCSVCKVELGRETKTIEATGHTLGGYREVPVNEATCTDGGIGRYTGYCSVCNQNIEAEDNKDILHNPLGHADKNKDGKCDACGIVTNACAKAIINVAEAKTVDYKTKVTIKATAENVPEGYYLVICDERDNQLAKAASDGKSTTEVSLNVGEITSNIHYFVEVVDKDGKIQRDADGNLLTKDGGLVTCNSGFFKKLIAFFKGLFGSLPSVEIKP